MQILNGESRLAAPPTGVRLADQRRNSKAQPRNPGDATDVGTTLCVREIKTRRASGERKSLSAQAKKI
jgi:hypothetical protein